MVDLVPELKLVIGDQPPVLELPPRTRKAASSWCSADSSACSHGRNIRSRCSSTTCNGSTAATLDLLEDLLTRPDLQHLMLIGAYRDNEVDATHPLMRKLEAIRSAAAGRGDHAWRRSPGTIWGS